MSLRLQCILPRNETDSNCSSCRPGNATHARLPPRGGPGLAGDSDGVVPLGCSFVGVKVDNFQEGIIVGVESAYIVGESVREDSVG